MREVVTSGCESHWMSFNRCAEEELLLSRMVEKYGSTSGMNVCLTYAIGVDVLTIVTGTVISGYKVKALSIKKSNNLDHGFEQSNQDSQGRMLFGCQASMKVEQRTFQPGGVGRSNPGRGRTRLKGQIQ